MIEVQCTSCHTRYRIDEQVLPEGTPTFKCSRCGHVFSVDPRRAESSAAFEENSRQGNQRAPRQRPEPKARARAEESSSEPASPPSPPVDPSEASAVEESPARAEANESTEPSTSAPETPAPAGPSTEELLARSFEEGRREEKPGESPSFEFKEEDDSDEPETPSPAAAEWDTSAGPDFTGFDAPPPEETVQFGRASSRQHQAEELVDAPSIAGVNDFMREEAAAPVYNEAVTHSARFFLLLCLIVGVGFGTMTFAIHNAPAGAADFLSRFPVVGERFTPATTPAREVALRDVHADYERMRGGQVALVISGTAENVSMRPLHVVEIAANLRQRSGPTSVTRSVYCGNNLSAKMLGQMTAHEVEFFQRLDPPKSFTLATSASCPFLLVFVDPPAGLNGFDISVARTIAAPADTETPGA